MTNVGESLPTRALTVAVSSKQGRVTGSVDGYFWGRCSGGSTRLVLSTVLTCDLQPDQRTGAPWKRCAFNSPPASTAFDLCLITRFHRRDRRIWTKLQCWKGPCEWRVSVMSCDARLTPIRSRVCVPTVCRSVLDNDKQVGRGWKLWAKGCRA